MADKIYRTYKEQIDILRSRGMLIKEGLQEDRIAKILGYENYYNVINGYKELFLASAIPSYEIYKPGATFDEIYALYNFDRELRSIYLKYLLKIENTFKTVIAHEFSAKYGFNNYLKIENFDTSSEDNISSAVKLIGDIHQEIARQMSKHHLAVTHYMTKYGYIPLWVLVNVLTFGKIENFYKNMKPSDRVAIAKQFKLQPNELTKFMRMLAISRNVCAHDERFFDIKLKSRIHVKSIKNFSILGIKPASDGSYLHGTNDAYAIAIMFALILRKSDIKAFVASMKTEFARLEKKLRSISIDNIQLTMGYSLNWQNLIRLNNN